MSQAAEAEPRYGCPECFAVFRTGFARCPRDGVPLHLLDDDPMVGAPFADRYVIEACIGEGGMGRVYQARHLRVSRRFAIKVLFGELATDPKMRARFEREAEAASRLDHPNVVSVVDFGETGAGLLYIVMDLVEGRSLHQIVWEEWPLPVPRMRRLVRQLACGLEHAHERELVHRDFKPENVIVCGSGETEQVRILDFGIALMAEDQRDSRLTTVGIVVGTPAYMAPEQAAGEPVDARTDLYALGVILYQMLAGDLPFSGTPKEIAAQNMSGQVPAISERCPGVEVDPELERLVHRLLARAPADRPQSAREVVAAIDALEQGDRSPTERSAAPFPQQPGELAAPRRRGRGALLLGGVALLAVAAAVALSSGGDEDGDAEEVGAAVASRAEPAVEPAPPPVEPAPPEVEPAAAAEDAEAAAVLPADAGVPDVARPLEEPRTPRRRRRRVAVPRDVPKPETVAPAEPPSATSLQRLYAEVGRSLQALAGDDTVTDFAELRRRYERIPIADALRKPALRVEAEQALERLRRDIARRTAAP